MQIKIITIPVMGGEQANEELNLLLRSKKILQVENQLISHATGVYCSVVCEATCNVKLCRGLCRCTPPPQTAVIKGRTDMEKPLKNRIGPTFIRVVCGRRATGDVQRGGVQRHKRRQRHVVGRDAIHRVSRLNDYSRLMRAYRDAMNRVWCA